MDTKSAHPLNQFTELLFTYIHTLSHLQREDFLSIKIIDSNIKKFGYNEHNLLHHFYRPPTKLRECKVFRGVCLSAGG